MRPATLTKRNCSGDLAFWKASRIASVASRSRLVFHAKSGNPFTIRNRALTTGTVDGGTLSPLASRSTTAARPSCNSTAGNGE